MLFASVQSSKDKINKGFRLLERSNNILEAKKKNKKKLDKNGTLSMKIMKKKQKRFLYQHLINDVIIIDAYAIKYVLGLSGRLCKKALKSVSVEDKIIVLQIIQSKLKELKRSKYMKPKKNYLKKEKRASEVALEKEMNIMFEL